jgi:hypothetical protein
VLIGFAPNTHMCVCAPRELMQSMRVCGMWNSNSRSQGSRQTYLPSHLPIWGAFSIGAMTQ